MLINNPPACRLVMQLFAQAAMFHNPTRMFSRDGAIHNSVLKVSHAACSRSSNPRLLFVYLFFQHKTIQPPRLFLSKSGFSQRFISILKYVLAGACRRCGRSQQIHPSRLNSFCKGVINTGRQRWAQRDALSPKRCQIWQKMGASGALTGTQLQARRSSFPQPDFLLLVPITTARLAGGERNIKTLIKSSRLSHVWALSLSECYLWLGFKFL